MGCRGWWGEGWVWRVGGILRVLKLNGGWNCGGIPGRVPAPAAPPPLKSDEPVFGGLEGRGGAGRAGRSGQAQHPPPPPHWFDGSCGANWRPCLSPHLTPRRRTVSTLVYCTRVRTRPTRSSTASWCRRTACASRWTRRSDGGGAGPGRGADQRGWGVFGGGVFGGLTRRGGQSGPRWTCASTHPAAALFRPLVRGKLAAVLEPTPHPPPPYCFGPCLLRPGFGRGLFDPSTASWCWRTACASRWTRRSDGGGAGRGGGADRPGRSAGLAHPLGAGAVREAGRLTAGGTGFGDAAIQTSEVRGLGVSPGWPSGRKGALRISGGSGGELRLDLSAQRRCWIRWPAEAAEPESGVFGSSMRLFGGGPAAL